VARACSPSVWRRAHPVDERAADPARLDRAGRPAFGFVLVVAFGLGMAVVMSGSALALVLARGRLDRFDGSTTLGRLERYVPARRGAASSSRSGSVPDGPGGRRRDDVLRCRVPEGASDGQIPGMGNYT
jgi:hypothetical protein